MMIEARNLDYTYSGAWLIFTAGLAYQSILVALLARRFETIMHR